MYHIRATGSTFGKDWGFVFDENVLVFPYFGGGKHFTMSGVAVPGTIEEIETGEETRVEKIPPYKVIFLNDDVTTMDFVVYVLMTVFRKEQQTAFSLMLEIHHKGSAVVDILPLEEAELRQSQVHSMARKEGYPLRCVLEPA